MRKRVALIWNGLLDVLYPPVCLVCGTEQADPLCPVCRREIEPIPRPYCDRCGIPISADRLVCVSCETEGEPPFAWSQAMGRYAGALRQAIHRLKYEQKTGLALPLGRLLAHSLDSPSSPLLSACLPSSLPAFEAVVPVPLHPSRLRKRGYNQAELLARVVAEERGWNLDTRGLRRIRRTQTQTALSPAERAANVQGAFTARSPLYFSGQSVLLVDDVLTTTATMRECAKVVQEAGAKRVCIVALASGS